MGVTAKLDKQINNYLGQLNNKQKKAVLTVIKTFAEEQVENPWEDDAFIAELDRRTAEYEQGKAKVYTLDQLEIIARKAYKTKAKPKR